MASDKFANENNLNPRAEISARAVAGVHWNRMGMGPLPATEKALSKAGISMDEVETIEPVSYTHLTLPTSDLV